MSRPSAAALAIIGSTGVETVRRPPPPPTLTDEQREIWSTIVDRMPADWFPAETHNLLEQYCRLVTRARRVAQLTEAMEARPEFEAREYRNLLNDEIRLSAALANLATRMRISQRADYEHANTPRKRKPHTHRSIWARQGDEDTTR